MTLDIIQFNNKTDKILKVIILPENIVMLHNIIDFINYDGTINYVEFHETIITDERGWLIIQRAFKDKSI